MDEYKGIVTVKVITKTFEYNYKEDSVKLKGIEVEYIDTSPREALDFISEVNSKDTEDEHLLERSSGNCNMVTCYATL